MRLINKNSRRGVVNLLADFILSKIDKKENSIIQVSDCGPFMVINGVTTSNEVLDIEKIKKEFTDWFSELIPDIDIDKLNTIDVIRYGEEVNNIETGWVKVNKDVFVEEPEPLFELSINSEFPYGYSLNCGRLMVYYSHYIFNHIYSTIGSDEIDFYFTKKINEDEDLEIKVISKSRLDNKSIESLILDVFDFDLNTFAEKLKDYDLFFFFFFPIKEKPYLKQDRLKDTIMF
jgi:hypothetical protein